MGALFYAKVSEYSDIKRFHLFVAPSDMVECVELYRTYIGQGNVICMLRNPKKKHLKTEKMRISQQYFCKDQRYCFCQNNVVPQCRGRIGKEMACSVSHLGAMAGNFEHVR